MPVTEASVRSRIFGERPTLVDERAVNVVQTLLEARDTAGIAERWQLEPARARVFVGGFVALHGLCEALAVQHLEVSEGALREGLIYDLLGRIRHEDVRDRTIADVIRRFDLDEGQAARVSASALDFLRQVRAAWDLNGREARHVLDRAARLHEIGLGIAYSGYHRHGAYIVEHADMAGFSRQDQQQLAVLLLNQRRKPDRAALFWLRHFAHHR